MSDEWGPWIEHDNAGWPKGVTAREAVIAKMASDGAIIGPMEACEFDWQHDDAVQSYRRRRPRALRELIATAEGLNARVPEDA